MSFEQPYTALIDSSTYKRFGHGDDSSWLTMHTVGNKPRNHAIYADLLLGSVNLEPRKAPHAIDGWSFMMRMED